MPIRALAVAAAAVVLCSAPAPARGAEGGFVITNHQPFPVRMPLRLRGSGGVPAGTTFGGQPVQRDGQDLVVLADLPPLSSRTADGPSGDRSPASPARSPRLLLSPTSSGVSLVYAGRPAGELDWGLTRENVSPGADAPVASFSSPPPSARAPFVPLPLSFSRRVSGPLFDTWSAEATSAGLTLRVDLDTYHAGYLDARAALTNSGAGRTRGVYCAVACRWTQPGAPVRSLSYDNRRADFTGTTVTAWRTSPAGPHAALARGVDWIASRLDDRMTAVWLHDFSESFAVLRRSRRGNRWVNANQPQLGQEARSDGPVLLSVTEITRPVVRRYADRFLPYVLPARGESVRFTSRLVFAPEPVTDDEADRMFVGFTCYREQATRDGRTALSLGVPHVKFGTSYFPYSTLGENFDFVKLPGQDREGYWPLSADVVNRWPLFADDIRRDLRLVKAMGFDVVRLHHLELLYGVTPEKRREFLDFLFGELRTLRLKALLDVRMRPEEVADLVVRYRDAVDGVEIENEVLIWGIGEGREAYWNSVYDAVKEAAPEIPVHLTAHTNVGIFSKLFELGGRSDRIGFHSYVDALDAIPSARGMALAVGNYAGKAGRPPVITEWNWRFLTRLPFEERARFYPEIIGKALETRSIPEFHQFQFIESLAMNPKMLRGLRHYEPLFLSRRPKPEAFELMKLIDRYGDPENSMHRLEADYTTAALDARGQGRAEMRLRNRTGHPLPVRISVESFGGLRSRLAAGAAAGAETTAPAAAGTVAPAAGTERVLLTLPPGAEARVPVELETESRDPAPGFYHFFLRLENDDGLLRYGWGEARLAGRPRLDLDGPTSATWPRGMAEELALDLSRPTTVVYGQDAPGLDVETAVLVAQTLECATGRPVGMYELGRLPAEVRARDNLILVGTAESNALIARFGLKGEGGPRVLRVAGPEIGRDWLLLTGGSAEEAERAAVDFVLRYWRHARDSAARRVGSLVESQLPKGSDPTKLP